MYVGVLPLLLLLHQKNVGNLHGKEIKFVMMATTMLDAIGMEEIVVETATTIIIANSVNVWIQIILPQHA